ncbi:hypothetical protein GH733_004714 [Mirounga leonina]|nr:hypothetical protein GH733_004714 [Mirounga leonina]
MSCRMVHKQIYYPDKYFHKYYKYQRTFQTRGAQKEYKLDGSILILKLGLKAHTLASPELKEWGAGGRFLNFPREYKAELLLSLHRCRVTGFPSSPHATANVSWTCYLDGPEIPSVFAALDHIRSGNDTAPAHDQVPLLALPGPSIQQPTLGLGLPLSCPGHELMQQDYEN